MDERCLMGTIHPYRRAEEAMHAADTVPSSCDSVSEHDNRPRGDSGQRKSCGREGVLLGKGWVWYRGAADEHVVLRHEEARGAAAQRS
jgi:hypothetical protein